MSNLLICHKFNEIPVRRIDTGCLEVFIGELSETMVEQVELNKLLVQREVLGIQSAWK